MHSVVEQAPARAEHERVNSGLGDILAGARRFACSSATGSPPSSAIASVQAGRRALRRAASPRRGPSLRSGG